MRLQLTTTLVILTAGIASPVSAGPLVPQRVMPDATWVVHFDIEAMVNSNLARALFDTEIGREIRVDISEDAMQELGIDPMKDLRGITLFGHDDDQRKTIVLVSATPAIDAPLAQLPNFVENYSEIREGSRVVHSWTDGGETMYAYAAPGSGTNERLVLLSGNVEELKRGMMRLEAGGADLAPALANKAPAAGSFIFFSADSLPAMIEGNQHASAMLRYAKGITFDAGESGNDIHAQARITTAAPEDANTMLQVVQGLMALGRMAATAETDLLPLVKIADGFRASAEGSAVNLSVRVDFAALAAAIQSLEDHHRDDDNDDNDDDEAEIRLELKKLEKTGRESREKTPE